MAIDPVCGMEVDGKKARNQSIYNRQTYYFCDRGCKKAFDEVPEKYVGDAEYAADTIGLEVPKQGLRE